MSINTLFLHLWLTAKRRRDTYRDLADVIKNLSVPSLEEAVGVLRESDMEKACIRAFVLNEWLSSLEKGQAFDEVIQEWAPEQEQACFRDFADAGHDPDVMDMLTRATNIADESARRDEAICWGVASIAIPALLGVLLAKPALRR